MRTKTEVRHRDGRRVSTPRNRGSNTFASSAHSPNTNSWLPMLNFAPGSGNMPRLEPTTTSQTKAKRTETTAGSDAESDIAAPAASSTAPGPSSLTMPRLPMPSSLAARASSVSMAAEVPSPYWENACAVTLPVTLFPCVDELAEDMAKIDLSKKDSDTQNPMLLSLQQPGQMFQFPTITSISVQEREAVFNVLEFVINHVKQQIGRAPPNVAHELEHDEYGNLLVRVSFSLAQLDQVSMLLAEPLKMHGDTFTWMTLKYETLVPLSFQTPSVHITMGHIHAGFQKFGKVRNLRPIISKDGCNYNGWRCLLTVRRGANIPNQITVDEKHYPGNGIVQLAVADDRAYCDKHYYMLPSFCGCPKSTNKTEDTAKTENAAETENTAVASE